MPTMDEIRRFSDAWEKFLEIPRPSQDNVFRRFWPAMPADWLPAALHRERHRKFFELIYNPVHTEEMIAAVERERVATVGWTTGRKNRASRGAR